MTIAEKDNVYLSKRDKASIAEEKDKTPITEEDKVSLTGKVRIAITEDKWSTKGLSEGDIEVALQEETPATPGWMNYFFY